MANQSVANLINVRVQNACKFVYKFASSLPIRKFSANSVLNLHTCKRICKFVGNPKLANKGIATVQTNSKFSSISLQRISITCNFLANPTFRPVLPLPLGLKSNSLADCQFLRIDAFLNRDHKDFRVIKLAKFQILTNHS